MAIKRTALFASTVIAALLIPSAAFAGHPDNGWQGGGGGGSGGGGGEVTTEVIASGFDGTSGATIGPDGALYVAEGITGEISRVDTTTGETSTFASGLPAALFAIGGVMDVEFVGDTAYVLLTNVGVDFGATDVSGIYRIDDADSFTVFADLGSFSAAHLPAYPVDLTEGVAFALIATRDGFVVTDGHHNRVLSVNWEGEVSELIAFDNVVPTGLAQSRGEIYMTEFGAIPYAPEDGRIIAISKQDQSVRDVASGYSALVDVEFSGCGTLYALSQGDSPGDVAPGSPALPNSGELLRVYDDGTFTVIAEGLNLPTSLSFAEGAAFVVAQGEVLRINNVVNDGDRCGGHHDRHQHGGHGHGHH
jgi:sugar lactone lactonase YvrE